MSGQNTLITCANDIEVKRPSGTLVSRQFYRDKSVQGLGVYKAMDENGNIEIVGGPGVGNVGSQLSVEVTYDSGTRTLTAATAGGTVASYAWTMKSTTTVTGEADAVFSGATNASTAVVANSDSSANRVGLATVKIVDTLGRISFGTYEVRIAGQIG